MKVFISWSGERSLIIAMALRGWLPRVIQSIQPWLSETDIGKGVRWEQEIGEQLAETKAGILCLTPENLDSRWINFEAGALSKTLEKTFVCTYLFELKSSEIEGPLSQFNHTLAEKDDTRRLVHSLNKALGPVAIHENIVDEAFELYWPRLASELSKLPPAEAIKNTPPQKREIDAMVEETLELVRFIAGNSQSFGWESKQRPRLPSTLDFSPEESELLLDHYIQVEKQNIGQYTTYLGRLRNDSDFARAALALLEGRQKYDISIARSSEEPLLTLNQKDLSNENPNS